MTMMTWTSEAMESEWLYENKPFELPEDASPKTLYGFVYEIENLANGKRYIGKKFFWSVKVRQVNKKKRRSKVESDWKEYYGSSDELAKDIEKYGTKSFRRTILYLCRTKGECAYYEAKEQFLRDVLLRDDYYNSWISARVRSSHLRLLKEDYESK